MFYLPQVRIAVEHDFCRVCIVVVPRAVFTDKGGLVSYDDERSICLKTEYADSRNLNGFVSCIEYFPD